MLLILHWTVCGIFGGLSALFLVANWGLLFGTLQTRKPTSLVFPFVSGPVCALACWLSPSEWLQRWAWVPLVLDFSLLALLGAAMAAIGKWFRRGNGEPAA